MPLFIIVCYEEQRRKKLEPVISHAHHFQLWSPLNLHVYLIPIRLFFNWVSSTIWLRPVPGWCCLPSHSSWGWMLGRNETDYAKEKEDRWIILRKLSPISTGLNCWTNHGWASKGWHPINKADRTVTLWVVTFLNTPHISSSFLFSITLSVCLLSSY